jgi:hypothetical protein
VNDTTKKTRARKSPVKKSGAGNVVAEPSATAVVDQQAIDKGDEAAAAVAHDLPVLSQKLAEAEEPVTEQNTLPIAIIPELTGPEMGEGDKLAARLTEMSNEIAWLLLGAGVAGIILPGVLGTPFFVVGVLVLLPGRAARIERWRAKYSSSATMNIAMKQINRFLDDIENRYPRRQR